MELIRTKKSKLSLDLAPLIDVVFQLLIFFMLTSAFANPAMKMTLPKAIASDSQEKENITISINQEGEVYLNDKPTSLKTLKSDLIALFKKIGNQAIHLKGDQDMPYKYFVEIMDIAKQAGAEHINIVHDRENTP